DAVGLALLRLRNAYLEDALFESGADRRGIDSPRQRDRPREGAVGALDPMVALALVLVLGPTLAGDREHVVLDLDRDIVTEEPGEIGAEDECVLVLAQIHRRGPPPGAGHGP